MAKDGIIFVLSGASGSGKTTICRRISSEESDIYYSISLTTRKKRRNERDGVDYFFLSDREFEKRKGELIEFATVYGNQYGTSARIIDEYLKKGMDVIMDIDTVGALNIKKSSYDSVLIYILPPDIETLKRRLCDRNTDSEETIKKRFNLAIGEMKSMNEYDYLVINDNLDDAVDKVRAIIKSERAKKDRILNKINKLFNIA